MTATAEGLIKKPLSKSRMFSVSMPKLQVAWDATSLATFLSCPRKYQYRILDGYISKRRPMTLEFGIAFHEALEAFYRSLHENQDLHQARLAGLKSCLLNAKDWDQHLRVEPSMSKSKAGDGLQKLDNYRTRFTLIRSFIWYTCTYEDRTEILTMEDGTPAIELSFMLALPRLTPDGEPYLLCGHMDGITVIAGGNYVLEHKSTKSSLNEDYWNVFDLAIQPSIYQFASNILFKERCQGVLMDAAAIQVGATVFGRNFIYKTEDLQREFAQELEMYIEEAERCAERDFWPKRPVNCYLCEFKKFCAMDPKTRKEFMPDNFTVELWDPTIPRDKV